MLLLPLLLFLRLWKTASLELPVQSIPHGITTLYDARSGHFSSFQLISKKKLNTYVSYEPMISTRFEHSIVKTEDDVFKTKKIGLESELNVRLGMLTLGASGSFLNSVDSKTSQRKVIGFSNYYQETSLMSVDFCDETVTPFISKSSRYFDHYTHIISGIVLGVELEVGMELENTHGEDLSNLESKMTAGIEYAFGRAKAGLEINYNSFSKNVSHSSKFKIRSKLNIGSQGNVPKTFEDIQPFLEKIPTYLNQTEGHRGAPLRLILQDIRDFQECYNFETKLPELYDLDENVMKQISQTLNLIDGQKQKFYDMKSDLDMFSDCFTIDVHNKLGFLMSKFEESANELKNNIRKNVIFVRSGTLPNEVFNEVIQDYYNGSYSTRNIGMFVKKTFFQLDTKFAVYKLAKRNNITCVRANDSLVNAITNNLPRISIFFMFKARNLGGSTYFRSLESFFEACKSQLVGYDHNCQVWDCDFALNMCQNVSSYSVSEFPSRCSYARGSSQNVIETHLQYKNDRTKLALEEGKNMLSLFEKNSNVELYSKTLENQNRSLQAVRKYFESAYTIGKLKRDLENGLLKNMEDKYRTEM